MKKVIYLFQCAATLAILSVPVDSWAQTSKPTGKDLVQQIVYAEGESFRGSPTSSVPAGTQYCGPNSEMGSDQDKQDAMTEMARVILRRQHCGLPVGDGTGTANPKPLPAKPLKSQKSSWDMAGKAADKAQTEWDGKSKSDKDKECKSGALYFFHLCYCCVAVTDEGKCVQSVEVTGEGAANSTELSYELSTLITFGEEGQGDPTGDIGPGGCVLGGNGSTGDCGCATTGNVTDAAAYSRIECPCCPHSKVPKWWGEAPQKSVGSNLYDPVTKCWRETKLRMGGK